MRVFARCLVLVVTLNYKERIIGFGQPKLLGLFLSLIWPPSPHSEYVFHAWMFLMSGLTSQCFITLACQFVVILLSLL